MCGRFSATDADKHYLLCFKSLFYAIVDGLFSEVELPVYGVDQMRITTGNEESEVSLEGACAMTQEPGDRDKMVVPESKQMKNIHVSCHGTVFYRNSHRRPL